MTTVKSKPQIITASMLEGMYAGDVYGACTFIRESHMKYPDRPVKPILKKDHSVADAKQYASDLEQHLKAELTYKKEKETVIEYNDKLDNELEIFVKQSAGLDTIPEQYRAKVWSYAWERSHHAGYGEVYGTLSNLVDIFK